MPKKGNLFILVKSLSRSEKRYFKLENAKGESHKNYLQLFDAIDKQVVYDEEVIKNLFANKPFIKQLHVIKIYLTELILKSLRNYHSNESINSQILDLLRDIEILFARELYDICNYKILKAEKLATKYEKEALLVEVLGWKRNLMIAESLSDRSEINNVLKKELEAINKLHDLNDYWNAAVNVFQLAGEKNYVKTLNPAKGTTLKAMTLHYHLLYSHYFMNGQHDKAEKEISQLILLLEQYPERIEDDPSSFVTAISNKIGILFRQKRWQEISLLISKMREVPVKFKLTSESKFTIKLWLRIFNLELELHRDTRELEKGIKLSVDVSAYMENHRNAIPDNYRIMLWYQIAGLYLMKGAFNKSLSWVNEILNNNFSETRNDLQSYTRIMNLIIHFELNNIIVLRYAVDACRRFLKKKKNMGSLEEQILLMFSRLSTSSPHDYKAIFSKAYNDIYTKNLKGLENIQDYIDLKSWMEGKIHKKRHSQTSAN